MSRDERGWIDCIQGAFAARDAFRAAEAWADAVHVELAGAKAGELLVSVDAALAGRHFPWPCERPADCGYRALAAATSDLAPVGATPTGLLLSAVIPAGLSAIEAAAVEQVLVGMAACAASHGLQLWGGNVAAGPLALHSVVYGQAPAGVAAGRGPLQPGDLLWLSGTHGDAMLALARFAAGADADTWLDQRYWRPQPRLAWGRALVAQPWVVGTIDVSDGWLRDLHNLGRTGGVGLVLDAAAVPRSEAWRRHGGAERPAAVWGGDDYELAFATRGIDIERAGEALRELGVGAICVGEATADDRLSWRTPPTVEPPPGFGYDPYL